MFQQIAAGDDLRLDAERRSDRRQRVLLGGKIGYLVSNSTCDCTVRNISKDGARIVAGVPWLPRPDPFLIVVTRAALHRCSVVWNDGSSMGLQFNASWDLADSSAESLGHFRAWWLELLRM
jgi:hypothetical protein